MLADQLHQKSDSDTRFIFWNDKLKQKMLENQKNKNKKRRLWRQEERKILIFWNKSRLIQIQIDRTKRNGTERNLPNEANLTRRNETISVWIWVRWHRFLICLTKFDMNDMKNYLIIRHLTRRSKNLVLSVDSAS